MRKTKKTLAILAIVAMVLTMLPIQAFAGTSTDRLAGTDRVETAIAIAQNGWTSADSVIVAPADTDNLVDALAVAPLAGQLGAPILMTYKDSLDSRVQSEITALGAKNVYAIGALSDAVANQLKAISGVTVTAVKGANRFETAAQVAAKLTNPAGSFVVGFNGLADAMSAASYAAANNYAILIAGADGTVPSSEAIKGSKVYTLGGSTLVGDIAGATRLAGSNRYDTNDQVLKTLTYKYDTVYVANGDTLVDALAGSALAAKTQSPIVLANTAGAAAAADVNKNMSASSKVVAFGGASVVPDSVVTTITNPGTVTPPPAAAGLSVSANMAAASTVVGGATPQTLVNLGSVTLTASGSDATVNGLSLTRSGLSKDTDIKNFYVWDGTSRLNGAAILSAGTATIGFNSPLTIPAGSSKTLKITADVATTAASGSQIVMTLASINTTAAVSGNLPAATGVLTVTTNITLGNLTVTTTTDSASGTISPSAQAVSLAKYKFDATGSQEDVTLNSVTFTNDGSAADNDVTNLKLYSTTAQVGSASMVNRKVVFTFNPGLTIKSGNSLTLELKGDTQSSFAGRAIQLDISNTTDVQATGATYGTTIIASAAPVNANSLSSASGSLNIGIDASSPAAANVSAGSSANTFAAFKVQASNEPVQIQNVTLASKVAGSTATTTNDISNVYIMNGSTQLAKVSSPFASATTNNITLSNPITVTPGTPVVLTVQADMASAAASNYNVGLTAISGQGTITTNSVSVSGAYWSNVMTIGSTNVAYAFGNTTPKLFPNQSGVAVGSITLNHNLSKNVAVSKLNVTVTTGILSNLRLADTSGNAVSNIISNVSTASAGNGLTLNTPVVIAPNASVTYNLLADVNADATTANTTTFGLNSTTPLIAYTPDNGNAVSGAGTTGLTTQTDTIGNFVQTNDIQLISSSVAGLGDQVVGLSQTGIEVAAATLSATTSNEPILLKKLTIALTTDTTGNASVVSNVKIVDGSGNVLANVGNMPTTEGGIQVALTTPLTIPASGKGSAEIAVLADFTSSMTNIGKDVKFTFGGTASPTDALSYAGQYSGISVATSTITGNGGSYTPIDEKVGATAISFTKVSVSNTNPKAGGGVEVGRVAIKNTGNNTVKITTMNLYDITTGAGFSTQGTTTATLTIMNNADGTVYGSQTNANPGAGQAIQLTTNDLNVAPGQTVTISIMLMNSGGISAGAATMLKVDGQGTQYSVPGTAYSGNFKGSNAVLDSISFQ